MGYPSRAQGDAAALAERIEAAQSPNRQGYWSKEYGLADVTTKSAVRPDTMFQAASISNLLGEGRWERGPHGKIAVASDGKSRTVTTSATDAKGPKVSGTAVYETQKRHGSNLRAPRCLTSMELALSSS
jgi:hypothetical protein